MVIPKLRSAGDASPLTDERALAPVNDADLIPTTVDGDGGGDDIVARMIAATPAARRCYDAGEEIRRH